MESMSDIFFTCSECGEYLVVDDKGAGLAVDCPDYHASITVPDLLLVHECPHCGQIMKAACEMMGEVVLCRSCLSDVRLPGNRQLVEK